MKKLALLALLPLFVSCGPYQIKIWQTVMDQSSTDPSKWPSACFVTGGSDAATFRTNNAATFEQFRLPLHWQTWEGKDKQYFLQIDGPLIALAETIAQAAGAGGAGDSVDLPAGRTQVIEGTDGKVFTATYTKKAKAFGDTAPQFTYTATIKVTWVNQDPATSGTIDVTVTRACTGTGDGACTDSNYSCAVTGIPFVARLIQGVTPTMNVLGDSQQP